MFENHNKHQFLDVYAKKWNLARGHGSHITRFTVSLGFVFECFCIFWSWVFQSKGPQSLGFKKPLNYRWMVVNHPLLQVKLRVRNENITRLFGAQWGPSCGGHEWPQLICGSHFQGAWLLALSPRRRKSLRMPRVLWLVPGDHDPTTHCGLILHAHQNR